jgi:hypothetical protein
MSAKTTATSVQSAEQTPVSSPTAAAVPVANPVVQQEDEDMLDDDLSSMGASSMVDGDDDISSAIYNDQAQLEIKTTIKNLNKLALKYAMKFNELMIKGDKKGCKRYQKLMDEINEQLKTWNQSLHRVRTSALCFGSGTGSSVSTEATSAIAASETKVNDKFLSLNFKDLPRFQLAQWPKKPFPSDRVYQSVDNYLWDLEKLVNSSNNVDLERHWKSFLPLIVDDKHARWIRDTINTAASWEEVKDLFKLKFVSTRATVNACTEALTMEMNYQESIADYTTRFINKCEMAHLELDNVGVVERFVASMTEEIRHQVNASWLNARSNENKSWNVTTASNIARELLGDNVGDYYRLYHGAGRVSRVGPGVVSVSAAQGTGSSRSEAKNGKSDVVAAAGNKFGMKTKHSRNYYCKIHGKNTSHSTHECKDAHKKRELKNTFYGAENIPRVAASSSVTVPCRYCGDTFQKGHKCPEYYKSDLYKARLAHREAKQVNAIKLKNKKKDTKNNKSLEEDEEMQEYLDEVEACKFKQELKENNFKLRTPILLEGEKLFAEVDTGSEVTLLNKATFKKLVPLLSKNYPNLNKKFIKPINGFFNFAASNQKLERFGKTIPLQVTYGEINLVFAFEIMPFNETMDYDILLGTDILTKLNIGLTGIQYDWYPNHIRSKGMSVNINYDNVVPNNSPYGTKEEYIGFMTKIKGVLDKNQKISKNSFCNLPESIIRLPMKEDTVVNLRQYPIPHHLRPVLNEEIKKWIDNGVVEEAPMNTRFNNPITIAGKKDKDGNRTKIRPCLDVRKLNTLLPNDSFQIPLIKDIFENLAHKQVFSSLDLASAYTQFMIHKDDREKVAFTHSNQQYVFVGAPFGLCCMPGNFSRVMAKVIKGMPFVQAFLDDLVVASNSVEEHIEHLNILINRLTEVNLLLNPEKCCFFQKEIILLGFVISAKGTRIDKRKLTNIDEWKVPTNKKEIMSLCGTINYFRDYVPMISQITAPIDALRNEDDVSSKWGSAQQRSFEMLKEILQSNNILHHADLTKPFYLHTDASSYGIAAVLTQRDTYNRILHIGFMSRSLSASERLYNTSKRELLSVVFGLKKFHQFLYARPFTIFTDHRALTYLHTQKVLSPLLYNWLETLLGYQYDCVHIPGIMNVLPDCLSRLYTPSFRLEEEDDFQSKEEKERIKEERRIKNREKKLEKDQVKKQLVKAANKPEYKQKLITCNVANMAKKLFNTKKRAEINDFKARYPLKSNRQDKNVYVTKAIEIDYIIPPMEEREKILKDVHSFGHFGIESIVKEVHQQGMHWTGLVNDAKEIVAKCPPCQKYNISKTGYNPLRPIMATLPGDHWSIDMIGPFPPSGEEQYTMILICIDLCTKYVILRPCKNKMSTTIANELVKIMADFGIMRSLSSDNGREFRNAVMHKINIALGIDRRYSIPFHARSRGAVENSVKTVLQVLRKYVNHQYQHWSYFLPATQLSINYKIRHRTNSSAFSLMFARKLNDFKDYTQKDSDGNYRILSHKELEERVEKMATIVFPAIQERVEKITQQQAKNFDKNHNLIHIENGTAVMAKIPSTVRAHKLAPIYQGPYIVVRKTVAGNYVLKDEKGDLLHRDYVPSELKVVSIDETEFEDEVYEVEEIRDHRGPPHDREYLIKWSGYGDRSNTWEKASAFTDPHKTIPQYWEKVKQFEAAEKRKQAEMEYKKSEAVKKAGEKSLKRKNPPKTNKKTSIEVRRSKRTKQSHKI